MLYRVGADAVLLLHAGFVLFVLLGGLLSLRWRRAYLLHLPAAAWGVWIEWSGGICPLTPLEVHLLRLGGGAGYGGGFVERWLLPALYPEELTRGIQLLLGAVVILVNLAVYAVVILRRRRG